MTPQEKAIELVDKFYDFKYLKLHYEQAKQCALIAVDEMIVQNGELYLNSLGDKTIAYYREQNAFLFKVKEELNKL